MASKYWIKLYHEILDDLKMGALPADLWRFTVELFLLAGELDCNGTLPNVTKIAWRLRYSVTQVETWLNELSTETDIITKTEGGWIVTNFAKRQAASEVNERVKQFRERQKKQKEQAKQQLPLPQNGNETLHQSIDTDTDTDIKQRAALPAPAEKLALIPAIEIHARVFNRRCLNQKQVEAIIRTVGADPPALEKWTKVLEAWNLAGYKPTRIDGQLDWFRNGIPVYQNGKGQSYGPNKWTQQGNTKPDSDDPIFQLFAGKPA